MTEPPLPHDVQAATRQHLHALDEAAPGLATALYVTGSVALGDYQQGRSDIDFMAFLSRPVTDPQTIGRLAEVHAGLAGPADYDGNYVAMACVPGVPDDEPSAPHVVGGQFHADEPNHQLTPATWAEFAKYAIAIRGPGPAHLGIRVPPRQAQRMDVAQSEHLLAEPGRGRHQTLRAHDPSTSISAGVAAWMALGPARLHYTLATGDIASKTAAGQYAAALFPAYRPILSSAATWRATGHGDFTYGDWIACAELALHIVADANRRWGKPVQP